MAPGACGQGVSRACFGGQDKEVDTHHSDKASSDSHWEFFNNPPVSSSSKVDVYPSTPVASHPFQLTPLAMRSFCPSLSGVPQPQLFPLRGPHGKKKVFQCPNCRYVTDRKNNLKRHIGTMHSDCGKNLECCDLRFRSKASLRDHIYLFHRSGYRCKFCGRNFVRKALLKRHLAIHMGQSEALELFTSWPSLKTEDPAIRLQPSAPLANEMDKQTHGRDHNTSASVSKHAECPYAPGDAGLGKSEPRLGPYPSLPLLSLPKDPHYRHVSPARPALRFWSSFFAHRMLHTHPLPKYDRLLLQVPGQGRPKPASAPEEPRAREARMATTTSNKRLCPAPYKCSSCSASFSHQRALEEHSAACGGQGERQAPVLPLRRMAGGGRDRDHCRL